MTTACRSVSILCFLLFLIYMKTSNYNSTNTTFTATQTNPEAVFCRPVFHIGWNSIKEHGRLLFLVFLLRLERVQNKDVERRVSNV